jgi:hypothetical protein
MRRAGRGRLKARVGYHPDTDVEINGAVADSCLGNYLGVPAGPSSST